MSQVRMVSSSPGQHARTRFVDAGLVRTFSLALLVVATLTYPGLLSVEATRNSAYDVPGSDAVGRKPISREGVTFETKVRMVNWKVGFKRPTSQDAYRIIAKGSDAPLIAVMEMEVPKDAEFSSAMLAIDGNAPYKMFFERRMKYKKYHTFFSLLVKVNDDDEDEATSFEAIVHPVHVDPDGTRVELVERNKVCCASARRSQKQLVFQDVKLSSVNGSITTSLVGINFDPSEKYMVQQLSDLESYLADQTHLDVVLANGDFNQRLLKPDWVKTKPASPDTPAGKAGKEVIQKESVDVILSMLQTREGRHQLLQHDPLLYGPPANKTIATVDAMLRIFNFHRLHHEYDPELPTYKRTPGARLGLDNASLHRMFFEMSPKKQADTEFEQLYIPMQRTDVPCMQLGWLDRAAWRIMRTGPAEQVEAHVSHYESCHHAMSDHAAVVTEFLLLRRSLLGNVDDAVEIPDDNESNGGWLEQWMAPPSTTPSMAPL